MPPTKSLCFRQIRWGQADSHFSEEEGIWHMIQHFRGDRHSPWCFPKPEGMTARVDPVGHSIQQIAFVDGYEPLKEDEAEQYEKLLIDALHGKLESVKASFDSVKKLRHPHLNPVQPVSTIAACKGHLPIVRYGLEKGAEVNRDVAFAIQKGSKVILEMLKYYEQDKAKYDDLIASINKRDPNYVPNVSDEVRRSITSEIKW